MTVIATAGHVDHGKSSLVRALTGTDPDRLAEEKRRGMTIELGFAHGTSDDGTVLSFVDVPGHADLVRTMIAGAGAVDSVLLVVDAREGWMPQTREHLAIVELLAVDKGVVAITKVDLVDRARIAEVETETRGHLAHSGIDWLGIVPVSSETGEGLDECRTLLARCVRHVRPDTARPRLFVDRVFTIQGAGTVVTGTLEAGTLRVDDEVVIARSGATGRVRGLQRHGDPVPSSPPGERCAVNLAGLGVGDIERGDALVRPGDWQTTGVVDARFVAALGADSPPRPGAGYTVHFGTDRQAVTLRPLALPDNWRVRFQRPWPMAPGDRFVVRRSGDGTTVAGGTVLDVAPRRRPSQARPDGTVESQLLDHGFVDLDEAARLTGAAVPAVVGRWCAARSTVESVRADLEARLDEGDVALDRLEPWERDLIADIAGVTVEVGVARRGADPLADHPLAHTIRTAGITGPPTSGMDRDVVRRLVAAGIVVEHDGIAFHRDTLDRLAPDLAALLGEHPGGFTVSHLRERLGITRKHAVPLATCLDRVGFTLRRGDVRVAGPRLARGPD